MLGATSGTPLELDLAASSGPAVVVRLRGEFDLSARDLFVRTVTEGVLQNGHSVVALDLSALTFIDSSGLHALLRARNAALAQGSRLVLVKPSRPVARALEVAGLAERFEVRSDAAFLG